MVATQLLTIHGPRSPKHNRKDNDHAHPRNPNTGIIYIGMMTAIKQLTRHIHTLRNLVQHPPVNVRVDRHDVVRRRELLPTAVVIFAAGAGALAVRGSREDWHGPNGGSIVAGGDVVVLEVVVFVVDQGAFVDASRFKIPITQHPKVILRQLQLQDSLIGQTLEQGTLPHVRHDRLRALIDRCSGSKCRRRDFRVGTTMSPIPLITLFGSSTIHIAIHDDLLGGRAGDTSISNRMLLSFQRIGRVGNVANVG
mmetsp:Transcript_11581/g.20326  ORF Transcript_11581/g.20326 Transcript_11581/m.20326 type:complete len:252 (+) Transcript_11581:300-1055(+)